MKEKMTLNPHAPGTTIRQVALEPHDLAEMEALLTEHVQWCSIAMEFIPDPAHLARMLPKLNKMRSDIQELQRYGVPTEMEEGQAPD